MRLLRAVEIVLGITLAAGALLSLFLYRWLRERYERWPLDAGPAKAVPMPGGGGLPPVRFPSKQVRAVGRGADGVFEEVRRQFKAIPGMMEGKVRPDSARCVDISTRAAIHGMMFPGIMAIVVPVVVGLVLGREALAGLLVGSLVTGLMLGIQTANSGGAMDNAKKYIEEGNFGGKGSDTHKAAVVGDTVGDPLKDTVGPSINILIKLMTVVSLVLAPLFI